MEYWSCRRARDGTRGGSRLHGRLCMCVWVSVCEWVESIIGESVGTNHTNETTHSICILFAKFLKLNEKNSESVSIHSMSTKSISVFFFCAPSGACSAVAFLLPLICSFRNSWCAPKMCLCGESIDGISFRYECMFCLTASPQSVVESTCQSLHRQWISHGTVG